MNFRTQNNFLYKTNIIGSRNGDGSVVVAVAVVVGSTCVEGCGSRGGVGCEFVCSGGGVDGGN